MSTAAVECRHTARLLRRRCEMRAVVVLSRRAAVKLKRKKQNLSSWAEWSSVHHPALGGAGRRGAPRATNHRRRESISPGIIRDHSEKQLTNYNVRIAFVSGIWTLNPATIMIRSYCTPVQRSCGCVVTGVATGEPVTGVAAGVAVTGVAAAVTGVAVTGVAVTGVAVT
eukprot:5031876-Pyramimonas_sp.AAC.1